MKTYTLTWRHSPFYGSTLSRCRFKPSSLLWPYALRFERPVLAFMSICCSSDRRTMSYRLSFCGRLIGRSATYQGV